MTPPKRKRSLTSRAETSVPDNFKDVVATFRRRRGVTLGPGWRAGGVVLKAGGKIFAMLVEGNLVAKLPRARVDGLVAERVGEQFDPRGDGRLMKEWIAVGPRAADWTSIAEEAYAFTQHPTKSPGAPRRAPRKGR